MSLFRKGMNEEEHKEEMRKLRQEIERQRKRNELLRAQHELQQEQDKYVVESGFSRFWKGLTVAGATVKDNLDREAEGSSTGLQGVSFNQDSITSGLPVVSDGSKNNVKKKK